MKTWSIFFLVFSLFIVQLFAQEITLDINIYNTYEIAWSFPDTCEIDDIAEFVVWHGKRTWKDSLDSVIVLSDSIHTNSRDSRYYVQILQDSLDWFGGYQFYFAVQAIDSMKDHSVFSDTITYIVDFHANLAKDSLESVIDYKDMRTFDDYYAAAIGKTFKIILPHKKTPTHILRFDR